MQIPAFMGTHRRILAAVFGLVLLAGAACSDADAAQINEIEAVDGLTIANEVSDVNADQAPISPVAQNVESVYQAYLDQAGQVIVGEAAGSALSGLASASLIEQVLGEFEANEQLRRDAKLSTIDQIEQWPNIAALEEGPGSITVVDCLERHEVNAAGQFNVYFVQQQVSINTSGDAWFVDAVDVMHNGFFEIDSQFGCLPPDLGKRAENAAIDAWSEFTAISQDPSQLGDGLSARFAPPLRPALQEHLETSRDEQWALTTTEEVEFHVLGVDLESSLLASSDLHGKTVVVATCHTFPEGRIRTDLDTGETLEQLPAGAVETQWIYVTLDTKPTTDPTHLDVVRRISHKGAGCNPLG